MVWSSYSVVAMVRTTPMQLHTRAYVLAYSHACANMCPVMSDGTLASLTYCTQVLHEGLHTRVGCSSGYIQVCYSRVAYV